MRKGLSGQERSCRGEQEQGSCRESMEGADAERRGEAESPTRGGGAGAAVSRESSAPLVARSSLYSNPRGRGTKAWDRCFRLPG